MWRIGAPWRVISPTACRRFDAKGNPKTVFKTVAFVRSAILPRSSIAGGFARSGRTRFIRKAGNYYQTELETLFYDTLSRPVGERPAGAPGPEIPFLNGGLFVRHYGDVSLQLPDALFDVDEGLIGFLAGWTFTVAEDVPDEVEVAVDPEMLGKVFENLISAASRSGTRTRAVGLTDRY